MALGIIWLFLYGFCKKEYLGYTFDDNKPVSENMSWIAIYSIVSIAIAVLVSAVVKLHTIAIVQNEATKNG